MSMEDLKALTECAECTWDYIDRLRMALASACKERDEMKKDICGIYCAGAFWKKPDGTCDHFEDYAEHRKRIRAERKKGGDGL